MNKKAQELAMHERDTGSSEVQIALLTDKIETVYCFKTSERRIWVNDIEFGDYESGSQEDWEPHFEQVKEQIQRKPMQPPSLQIPKFNSIDEVLKSNPKDFRLVDYNPMESIKAPMAV